MATLKKLAGETFLYGISSILGRFINWLMVPLYTYVFQEPNYPKAEYGIQTKILACVAVVMVVITYGMETSYFRFASDAKESRKQVFSTSQTSLLITSGLFVLLVLAFLQPLSVWLNVADRSYILVLLAFTLGIDAYCSIPFAKLRLDSRPLRFAIIKLLNIGINVLANLFFFLFCPHWLQLHPDSWVQFVYQHEIGIGYVFISYFLAAFITLLLLLPTLRGVRFSLHRTLLRKMLHYAFPIMLVGIAGTLNLHFDKIIMENLLTGDDVMGQVGEYGAAFKLGVLMTLFAQAYRYAFEPFFFSNKTAENAKELYADALKFFTIIGLVGFLAVVFYLDIVGLIIGKSYHNAFVIVPYVLLANLFLGMYYSLSLWYKLTDKTQYGAYMAFVGVFITVVLNILLVPLIGYIGAAYAFLIASLVMFLISLFWGQQHYPIAYDLKRIAFYFFLAIVLCLLSYQINFPNQWLNWGLKTVLLFIFVAIVWLREPKLRKLRLKK
ncbi:MAG: hypothetical protein CSB01_02230 [Bacteroidia bacterium]|nr:MAG: hypothetical protein CSB01_02230 [Bacteroidia bacterium]